MSYTWFITSIRTTNRC